MPAAAARAAASGGEAGHLVDHRGGADVRAVRPWAEAAGRVHDQLHLALGDELDRVGGHALLPHLGDERVHRQALRRAG